jgi:hypothetical protein
MFKNGKIKTNKRRNKTDRKPTESDEEQQENRKSNHATWAAARSPPHAGGR